MLQQLIVKLRDDDDMIEYEMVDMVDALYASTADSQVKR